MVSLGIKGIMSMLAFSRGHSCLYNSDPPYQCIPSRLKQSRNSVSSSDSTEPQFTLTHRSKSSSWAMPRDDLLHWTRNERWLAFLSTIKLSPTLFPSWPFRNASFFKFLRINWSLWYCKTHCPVVRTCLTVSRCSPAPPNGLSHISSPPQSYKIKFAKK